MEMLEVLKALKELGVIQTMPAVPVVPGAPGSEAEKKPAEPVCYTAEDIRRRYGIGINGARAVIRSIRHVNGGLALGEKVLPSELRYWEENRGRAPQEVPR